MANCLKCKHREAMFKACMSCTIAGESCGLSHGGVGWVSMDAAPTPEHVLSGRIAPDYRAPSESVELVSPLGEDERFHLLEVLRCFSALSWDDAGLICSMLGGKTLDVLAEERGVSLQAVHARWQRVIKRQPIFASLANGLIGRGAGRTKKKSNQMEFF